LKAPENEEWRERAEVKEEGTTHTETPGLD